MKELNDVQEEYVEVYFKKDLIYRGFLIGIDDGGPTGEQNFIICGIKGEGIVIPMSDTNWEVVHLTDESEMTPWKLIRKELGVICTEKTGYEMLSFGFFSGFMVGFLLLFVSCILFF